MKLGAAGFGFLGIAAVILARPQTSSTSTLVILGNHLGYLSPCGCTKPMLGGILRQASVIRGLESGQDSVLVDTGNLSSDHQVQDVLKAQTLGAALKTLHVAAVGLTEIDSRMGSGELSNLQNLTGQAFVTTSLSPLGFPSIDRYKQSGGFLITSVSVRSRQVAQNLGAGAKGLDNEIAKFAQEAISENRKSILMIDGNHDQAMAIARQNPSLSVVTFVSKAEPPLTESSSADSPLVISPGEHGEYLVTITFGADGSRRYQRYVLGEEIKDDPTAGRLYREYLDQVVKKHLWQNQVRLDGPNFAGSARCGDCHARDFRIWSSTSHATALRTLEPIHHSLDPECLKCHITGASFKNGFSSLQTTPQLGAVGCESCHGAGAAHARQPRLHPLPTVTPSTCEKCHDPLNSPHFDFSQYWVKIKH